MMSNRETAESASPALAGAVAPRRGSAAPLVLVFAAALFASAALMFIAEPLVGKVVLPRLGGAPAVWNTCVVFYQAVLLAGYAYAHLLAIRLRRPAQLAVHLGVLALACLALPLGLPGGWRPPVGSSPIPALLAGLTLGVGAPLFALSATPPLLQHWFSRSGARSSRDPYFLYAASNLGSMLGLLAYPLLIEPLATLGTQRAWWSAGFVLLILLTVVCGLAARGAGEQPGATAPLQSGAITWARRGRWLALSAVPASLMLGVTTYASTDIAAVPLLWMLPLALYLASFTLAFAGLVRRRLALSLMTALTAPLLLVILAGINHPILVLLPLHLAGLFAIALVLHTLLADDRPAAGRLTEFYLWIALGGVLGGAFNALLAPLLFDTVAEYPAAIAAASLLAPGIPRRSQWRSLRAWIAPVLAALLAASLVSLGPTLLPPAGVAAVLAGTYLAYAMSALRLHQAVAAVAIWAAATLAPRSGPDQIFAERTFFGVLRVWNDPEAQEHRLTHGTTNHGIQSTTPAGRGVPLGYYHPRGPIGQVFAAAEPVLANARIGVVGLGTGALAAYHRPGQRWTFYELDPAIERVARDPRLFTYLGDCGQACTVTLGDGRISLARERAPGYRLLILDAFSSDAIPVHLLTREAIAVYLAALDPGGLLAIHISNRNLDLRPVVARLAADARLSALWQYYPGGEPGVSPSAWVVLSRSAAALQTLADDARWAPLKAPRQADLWTDDFSNILRVLRKP